MKLTLQELQDRFERLSALQSEIQQLKAEITENEIGFAQTQAEMLVYWR